jgi:hypothetical protein
MHVWKKHTYRSLLRHKIWLRNGLPVWHASCPKKLGSIAEERCFMAKKAIAYISDIILGRTGEVISRSYQADLINKHASENDIEILAWFEDEAYNEDVLSRPGIRGLLAFGRPYDLVLCERVWALSRSTTVLESFFEELENRRVKFEAATTMWDCVSQKCRRRFSPLRTPAPLPALPAANSKENRAHVRRPAHMHFTSLVGHAAR